MNPPNMLGGGKRNICFHRTDSNQGLESAADRIFYCTISSPTIQKPGWGQSGARPNSARMATTIQKVIDVVLRIQYRSSDVLMSHLKVAQVARFQENEAPVLPLVLRHLSKPSTAFLQVSSYHKVFLRRRHGNVCMVLQRGWGGGRLGNFISPVRLKKRRQRARNVSVHVEARLTHRWLSETSVTHSLFC